MEKDIEFVNEFVEYDGYFWENISEVKVKVCAEHTLDMIHPNDVKSLENTFRVIENKPEALASLALRKVCNLKRPYNYIAKKYGAKRRMHFRNEAKRSDRYEKVYDLKVKDAVYEENLVSTRQVSDTTAHLLYDRDYECFEGTPPSRIFTCYERLLFYPVNFVFEQEWQGSNVIMQFGSNDDIVLVHIVNLEYQVSHYIFYDDATEITISDFLNIVMESYAIAERLDCDVHIICPRFLQMLIFAFVETHGRFITFNDPINEITFWCGCGRNVFRHSCLPCIKRSYQEHDRSYTILLSGDVEENPGPFGSYISRRNNGIEVSNQMLPGVTRDLSQLLILSGDVELNPGPVFSSLFNRERNVGWSSIPSSFDRMVTDGVKLKVEFNVFESLDIPLFINVLINLYNSRNYPKIFIGVITQYLLSFKCSQQVISQFLTWCTKSVKKIVKQVDANEEEQRATSLVGMLGSFLHCVVKKALPSTAQIEQLNKFCRCITGIGGGLDTLVHKIPKIFSTVLGWLSWAIYGVVPDALTEEYIAYVNDVTEQLSLSNRGALSTDDVKRLVDTLHTRGQQLAHALTSEFQRDQKIIVQNFRLAQLEVVKIRSSLQPVTASNVREVVPYVIVLYGPSQIGKSQLTRPLIQYLSLFDKEIQGKFEDKVYFRNSETEFWDGLKSEHKVFVYDDFAQVKDTETTPSPEFMDFIRLNNPVPAMAHMASVEDKGRHTLDPRLVIATTNLNHFPVNSMTHPAALYNRLKRFFGVELKPEFGLEGKIDLTKVKDPSTAETQDDYLEAVFGMYNFRLYELNNAQNKANFVKTNNVLDYKQFLQRISQEFRVQMSQCNHSTSDTFQRLFQNFVVEDENDQPQGDADGLDIINNPGPPDVNNDINIEGDAPRNVEQVQHIEANVVMEKHVGDTSYRLFVSQMKREPLWRAHFEVDHVELINFLTSGEAKSVSDEVLQSSVTGCTICNDAYEGHILKHQVVDSNRGRLHTISKWIVNAGVLLTTFCMFDCLIVCVKKFAHALYSVFRWFTSSPEGTTFDDRCFDVICIDDVLYFTINRALRKQHSIPSIYWRVIDYFELENENDPNSEIKLKATIKDSQVYRYMLRCNAIIPISSLKEPSQQKKDVMVSELATSGDLKTNRPRPMPKLGSPVVALSKELLSDPQLGSCIEKMKHSLVEVGVYTNSSWRALGYATALRSNFLLSFLHLLPILSKHDRFYLKCRGWTNPIEILPSQVTIAMITKDGKASTPTQSLVGFKESYQALNQINDFKDMCVIQIKNAALPIFGDIVNKFIEKKQLNDLLGHRDAVMVGGKYLNNDTDICQNISDMRLLTGEAVECNPILDGTDSFDSPVVTQGQGLAYSAHSQAGDCGSLLLLVDKHVTNKVLGLHVGGAPNKQCFGVTVTTEEIFGAMEVIGQETGTKVTVREVLTNIIKFDAHVSMPDSFVYHGDVAKLHRPEKTNLEKSPIFEKYAPSLYEPSVLSVKQHEGVFVDPLIKGVHKYAQHKNLGCELQFNHAATAVFSQLLKNSNSISTYKRNYTLDESLWGIDGDIHWGAINTATSMGYGWNSGGMPGKRAYINNDAGQKFVHPQFIKAINDRVEKMDRGVVPTTIYVDTLKDEKRKKEKVAAMETRVFSSCPADYAVLVRQYFGGFLHWTLDNCVSNRLLPGINMYSNESHIMAQRLRKYNNFIAGDFKNFDGSANIYCTRAIYENIIKKFYAGVEGEHIRNILFQDIDYSTHLCGTVVYSTVGGIPSGNPLTATLNSLVNYVNAVYVWMMLTSKSFELQSAFAFFENVESFYYGDDNIASVSERAKHFYNHQTLKEAYKTIGYVYTNAKKIETHYLFDAWDEVSILKRNFVYDKDLMRWVTPIDRQTIVEMLNWIRSSSKLSAVNRLMSNIEASAREYSLHSKEEYDAFVEKISAICLEALGLLPSLDPYEITRGKVLSSTEFYA